MIAIKRISDLVIKLIMIVSFCGVSFVFASPPPGTDFVGDWVLDGSTYTIDGETITAHGNVYLKANSTLTITGTGNLNVGRFWSKRIPITINNSGSSDLTDYQVWIPTTVFDAAQWSDIKGGTGQDDLDDVRFASYIAASGYWQSCPYWIDDNTATPRGFWVKVPSVPTGSSTIYMYYGSTTASAGQSGDDTFEFFDDYSSDSSSQYDIGRHADTWHGGDVYNPYYDAANERVAYDTGDNYSGGWKPTALSLKDLSAKVTMGVTGSYPTHTTNGLLVRWIDDSQFYGIKIAGGSYNCVPGLIEDGRNGEIQCPGSNTYHPMDGTPFTLEICIYDNQIKGIYNEGEADEVVLETTDPSITVSGQVDIIIAQAVGWWDDFRVRKYASPEPTTSAGTTEDTPTTGYYIYVYPQSQIYQEQGSGINQ